jgi:hypothetical protein
MLHKAAIALTFCLLAAASTGVAATSLSIKDEMKTVVEPASNALFAVGGEADPANDPKPNLTDARWAEAAAAAEKLKAVAAGLAAPGRAKDQGVWMTDAKLMSDIADAALKAAKAKDGAGLSTAANNLGDACTTCHTVYKPKT